MSVGRNVLAGVTNSAWAALLAFAALPLYLRFLGIEQYGLVGFYATAQAMLQLLDMGLAPTMNRQVAYGTASGRVQEVRNLLHTLTVVYWAMAAGIAIGAWLLAPMIAEHWLQARTLDASALRQAVEMMGLVVACRWPMGLYQGALMGMQRLATVSAINIAMVTLSTGGAIVVLALISSTVQAFFAWQAAVAVVQVLVMRRVAWRHLGREGSGRFNVEALRQVWRFSAGMGAIAVASVLLTQLDKLILSRMLSLEQFGSYALAGVVAGGLYVLLTPVFNVIYPRMTALLARGESDQLLAQYRSGSRLLASVLFPLALGVACFAADLLYLWTGNQQLSAETGPLVTLLILGTSMNGVMHFPLALQLASGRTGLTLAITVILTIALVPMIVFLAKGFGAIGGAAAWFSLNLCYLVLGSWMTHRKLLDGKIEHWLTRDVGVPLAFSTVFILSGWWFLHQSGPDRGDALVAAVLVLSSLAFNLALLPRATIQWLRASVRAA